MAVARELAADDPDMDSDWFFPVDLFPVLKVGADACGIRFSGEGAESVWIWYWEQMDEDPNRAMAASLVDLLATVESRYESGAYYWDDRVRMMSMNEDLLPKRHWVIHADPDPQA